MPSRPDDSRVRLRIGRALGDDDQRCGVGGRAEERAVAIGVGAGEQVEKAGQAGGASLTRDNPVGGQQAHRLAGALVGD